MPSLQSELESELESESRSHSVALEEDSSEDVVSLVDPLLSVSSEELLIRCSASDSVFWPLHSAVPGGCECWGTSLAISIRWVSTARVSPFENNTTYLDVLEEEHFIA